MFSRFPGVKKTDTPNASTTEASSVKCNVQNVIIANVFIKWAWYARMIRTGVLQYRDRNFVQFSRCVGMPERFILFRHLLPSITSDLVVLASLDIGWAIINISTLSFLGLGVQAPTPEDKYSKQLS